MVRKLRKYAVIFATLLLLICNSVATVKAVNYTVYEGNISTSVLTYFKDILANVSVLDNYVLVRSGQNEYNLIVGDIDYSSGKFTSSTECTVYTLNTNSSYNAYYTYDISTIDNMSLNTSSALIYSDLGGYPQLEERGGRFEVIQTIIIVIIGLCVVVRSIFNSSKSR